MTPELARPSPNYHTDGALDRFNVHRCPTRRVLNGTGLELVTRQATIRYLYRGHPINRNHSMALLRKDLFQEVINSFSLQQQQSVFSVVISQR
ncbi:hypothetical protein TNCV_225131 [Trichonephila clavipes]|nr:hypothetical protein TNCV_225131 [Trichonephila clavipes]